MHKHIHYYWLYISAFLPFVANAAPACTCPVADTRCICTTIGTSYSFWAIVSNVVDRLVFYIVPIAITMFLVGAFMITISGVQEGYRQTGKNLIMGSLISLVVVMGAFSMLRMIDYFLS